MKLRLFMAYGMLWGLPLHAITWDFQHNRNVGGWRDIIQVATGAGHTVGLKDDGTVVAVGTNKFGECDVDGWNLVTAPMNWPLIGGIIAVVIVGLVIFFVRRRRAA